jgi:hypothetical protein
MRRLNMVMVSVLRRVGLRHGDQGMRVSAAGQCSGAGCARNGCSFVQRAAERSVMILGVMNTSNSVLLVLRTRFWNKSPK